jgi:POT family proton-dependent oligopeptide transporter
MTAWRMTRTESVASSQCHGSDNSWYIFTQTEQDAEEFEMQAGSSSTALRLHEIDGIHDGLVAPTEEERLTLRRIADTVPWSAYCATHLSQGHRIF